MNIRSWIIWIFVFLAASVIKLECNLSSSGRRDKMLKNLEEGHPGLIFTAADQARTEALRNSDLWLDLPEIEYRADSVDSFWDGIIGQKIKSDLTP